MTLELSFAEPPVVEVALSVSFSTAESFHAGHLGVLWESKFKDSFPRVEVQAGEPPPVEQLNDRPIPPAFGLQVQAGPIPMRMWLLNTRGTELIQLQTGWFARNWRRQDQPDLQYPRFSRVREAFVGDLEKVTQFLSERGLGNLNPIQCEVAYVNHIVGDGMWSNHGDFGQIFSFGGFPALGSALRPEATTTESQFLIEHRGSVVGRFYVQANPAFRRKDNKPIYVLTLTARGLPLSKGVPGVLSFIDLGHDLIIQTFLKATSSEAQTIWRPADGDQA